MKMKALAFPGGSDGKNSASNAGDLVLIPEFNPWIGKIPWSRHGNPLWYSCMENPMDRGARQATVPRATKSQT